MAKPLRRAGPQTPATPDAPSHVPRAPDARRWGMLLLLVLVGMGAAGVPLALTYDTDPARAHDAVRRMAASFLATPRGIHAWGASAVLALTIVHFARAYVAGRLRAPGRGVAIAGLASLALLTGAYFTGTILPWDQQGWEAMQHLDDGTRVLGADVVDTDAPTSAPLRAVFLVHVLAVPAALALVLSFHVRRAKLATDAIRLGRLARPLALPALGIVTLLAALSWLVPPELGPAPIEGLAITRPDWPFLWLVPLQDAWGAAGLLALPLALLLAGALLWRKHEATRRTRLALLTTCVAAWALLTFLGAR